MEQPRVERRLAAILAADVVGYSRLMEVDEAGTLARLKHVRRELIDPAIAKCKGRLFKTTGDGMLVEFPSVTDAVQCAVDFQRRMADRNAITADGLRFRIGINLGDMIVEGDDVFGDGVNVAARLEAMADPGGICISSAVRDQVGDRIDVAYEDIGDHNVKNISRPIRIFRVRIGAAGEPAAQPAAPREESARVPSIAVLPFVNMSGDPDQEFFADGLTEDIITEVARFHDLLVISRNAVFVHKGKPVTARGIAKEFGVDYVVEGSVRKAADRVRVTVQLIDGATERHVWAERYDRKLEDIFAIQDEVTAAIAGTLRGRVEAATHERANNKPTDNMAAYEYVLTGKVLHHRSNWEANQEALRLLERAIALDPKYAHAHAWKACVLGQRYVYNWFDNAETLLIAITSELETALSLDENDADVHRILAAIHLTFNRFEKAVYHQSRAVELSPNYDLAVVQQGELLTWLGRPDEGIEWIRKAMRLNPYHPERFWSHLGRAQFVARDYAGAMQSFARIARPDQTHHAFMAAASAELGDATAAQTHARRVLELAPDFTIEKYLGTLHYSQQSDLDHHRDALLKASLPP